MLKLTLTILLAGFVQQALLAPNLDPGLVRNIDAQGTTNVLVTMKEGTGQLLATFKHRKYEDRADRLNSVGNSLREFAAASQKNVLEFLVKEQVKKKELVIESLWTTNQIILRDVDLDTLKHLVTMSEISDISEERFIPLEDPIDLTVHEDLPEPKKDKIQWGVREIEAPKVWASGNRGEGIIIATIDTGVRVTHEAVKDNFVGAYGWYDPAKKSSEPNDNNGHGTHTTSNICGTVRNVGVAPASKWIACKGCASSFCSQIDLLACGQFIACPTDTEGANPDCSKAPHLVSNSWGGTGGTTWFSETIKVWRTVVIIPLFSQGNYGPFCGSANAPGDDPQVIGVGATDNTNTLSYFSSVGPTRNGGRIKPDVAAPGANVFAAYNTSDSAYASLSGTSMASPHVAGAVALLLAEHGKLTYDEVYFFLAGGSVPTVPTDKNCNGIPENEYPNHHVGYGRINVKNSITHMRRMLKH